MANPALYTFKDKGGEYHVYKHYDGYPTGALGFIAEAKKLAWDLPRFEADEFAAAFIAANKGEGGGGVRLTIGNAWGQAAPSDIEYHYVITCKTGSLHIEAYSANCWDKPTHTLLNAGPLAMMQIWALKEAA